ncbi:MAG: glycine cleavage system protein GcvH [Pseudomonadales bacterium]
MSEIPAELRYAATHEWARLESDGTVTVGITDHAQDALGDVVFVELPETGRELGFAEESAVVESVKAASDIYAPVAGTVIAVNDALVGAPELVNQSPYGDGWFFRIAPAAGASLEALLDAAGYAAACAGDAH